jgi:hypothetical protein
MKMKDFMKEQFNTMYDKNIEMLKDMLTAKKHVVLTNKENYH